MWVNKDTILQKKHTVDRGRKSKTEIGKYKKLPSNTIHGSNFDFLRLYTHLLDFTGTMPSRQSDDETTIMAPMTSDYNQLNQSQSTVWKYAQPLFAKAMEDLPIGKCFRVGDLGCATGGNSIAPLTFVSSQLSTLSSTSTTKSTTKLEVFLGDLPSNDWNTVVSTVTPEVITDGHDRSPHDTFVNIVGRSFYDVCVPNLDLSYSLVAVHWMKS